MQWTQLARCLTHPPEPCFSFCSSFTRGSPYPSSLLNSRHQGTCKSLKGPGTCRIWQFLGVHNSARLLEPPVTNNRPPPGRSTFCWLEVCWKVLGPVVYVFLEKKDEDKDDLFMVHALWNLLKPIFFRDGETFLRGNPKESNLGDFDVVNPTMFFLVSWILACWRGQEFTNNFQPSRFHVDFIRKFLICKAPWRLKTPHHLPTESSF